MKQVCVIGSINLDVVLQVDRVPQAGENLYARAVLTNCGGKGENAAIALSQLGVSTSFLGCVGNDETGKRLTENLTEHGVDASHLCVRNCASGVAYIILEANSENRIIVAPGANETMTRADIRAQTDFIRQADLVLIQLEIAPECIEEIVCICRELDKRLIVDAGPVRGIRVEQLSGAYCVSPNESELEALAGRKLGSMDEVKQAALELLRLGIGSVLVKLGSKGCLFQSAEESFIIPAFSVEAVDTTGAGDSFMAGYCAALLDGKLPREAAEYACKCGAIAVTKMGASALPTWREVENFESFLRK